MTSPYEVAEAVGGPTTAFEPQRGKLSERFSWFADSERLCVIARDRSMTAKACDIGFAHALGHLGDRDLSVVFPEVGAKAVAQRLPFLDVPVVSFVLQPDEVERLQPLRSSDVIASFVGTRGGIHDLTEALPPIEPLLEWISNQVELVEDDRKSYRTWHYRGRQVLTIRVLGTGLVEVVAGVNYSKPKPGTEPVVLQLTEPINDSELARVQNAIEVARAGRDSGTDTANAEHLLQEMIRKDWAGFGLRGTPLREVPAWRPVGAGFIDLVGAGRDGRIKVIETKIGPYESLVLQGLDYWIWVNANLPEVADWVGLPSNAAVDLEFVVAERKPGRGVIGSYTAGQAESLSGAIRWSFTTVRNWVDSDQPKVERSSRRMLPSGSKGKPAARKAGPRWSIRLARHLTAQAKSDGISLRGGVFWPDVTDGLEATARPFYEQLVADGLVHDMVGHVRSSQAFALNLFAPLDEAGRISVAAAVGIEAVEVGEPRFEWSDPRDYLGERTQASPHASQVDVILDCVTENRSRTALLIEVKLGEEDFGRCSGWLSAMNDRLDVCATPGPFGNDVSACFQLRNHDRENRRRYDTALGQLSGETESTQGCWFRFGANQAMRNVALARTLIRRGDADEAVVALCAPSGHKAIWRRWAEAKMLLPVGGVILADLPAETVVDNHEVGSKLSDRYLLDRAI